MKQSATIFLGLLVLLCSAPLALAQDAEDVTVRELNAIPQENVTQLEAAGADLTREQVGQLAVPPAVGKKVRFTAVVLSDPRTSGLGTPNDEGFPSRIHVFVRDTTANSQGKAGMDIQLVDGSYQTTGLLNTAVGDVVTITGTMAAFTGSGGAAVQLEPETVELLGPYTSFDLPDSILDPVLVSSSADVNKSVGNDRVQTNWSNLSSMNSQYIRLEGATVLVRDISTDRPNFLVTSDGGETVINFYDASLRFRNDRDGGYNENEFNVRALNDDFVPPPPGAKVNIQGFLVHQGDDPFSRGQPEGAILSINPWQDADLEVTETPPEASIPSTPASVVAADEAVTVTTTATADPTRSLAGVTLNYFTSNDATVQSVPMTLTEGDTYEAEIPGQPDDTFVIYSVTAEDNTGATFSSRPTEFRVLSGGITAIRHIQEVSGHVTDASPFVGLTTDMNLTATVQTDGSLNNIIAIQDDPDLGPWSGVVIRGSSALTADLNPGDVINITNGRIEESFGLTRLRDITYTKQSTGGSRLEYKSVSTVALQDPTIAEAHEGMLLRFDDVTVTNLNPDAPANHGEFSVSSDGTASSQVRVDDASSEIASDFNTTLSLGDRIEHLQGVWIFSFANYKLVPERASDIGAITTSIDDEVVPGRFALAQNYPNPFNPVTTIRYSVETASAVTLEVFDVMGRRVALIADGVVAPGVYEARFDGSGLASGLYVYRLTAGAQTTTKKMVLMK